MNLAPYIEHTLLRPDAKDSDYLQLCMEANKSSFYGVCVPVTRVKFVSELLLTNITLVTVLNFPHGNHFIDAVVSDANYALENGADELDYVVNISDVKSGKWEKISDDIAIIAKFIHQSNKVIKVIIEIGLLEIEEVEELVKILAECKVDYVKTSTGFNARGVTVDDVVLLRKLAPPWMKIKASGGIKTKEFALSLINAGSDKLGTSSGIELIKP